MEPTINQDVTATPEPSAPTNKKENSGLKIATIICAVLAVAGIGLGVYGMVRKPEEKPVENNTAELETELSSIKQKYIVLQNYVKELEASGTEIPEDAKSATEGADTLVAYGFTAENIHSEQYKNIPIELDLSSYGKTHYELSPDGKITAYHRWENYNESDLPTDRREKDDLTDRFDSRVIDMVVGHVGNGASSIVFFLQDNGKVAWISDFDLAKNSSQAIAYVESTQEIIRIYGNNRYVDIAGFAQTKSGEIFALKPVNNNGYTVSFILE